MLWVSFWPFTPNVKEYGEIKKQCWPIPISFKEIDNSFTKKEIDISIVNFITFSVGISIVNVEDIIFYNFFYYSHGMTSL